MSLNRAEPSTDENEPMTLLLKDPDAVLDYSIYWIQYRLEDVRPQSCWTRAEIGPSYGKFAKSARAGVSSTNCLAMPKTTPWLAR